MSVIVTSIKNPFKPEENIKDIYEFKSDKKLSYYLEHINLNEEGINFSICINGDMIDINNIDNIEVKDNDIIAVCAKVEVTAAAGAIASFVASSFAGATVASLAGAWAVGFGTALVYGAAYLATTFVIGYGLSALASSLAPDAPALDDAGVEQTYGWGELQQTAYEGIRIPLLYGAARVAGQEINKFVTIEENKEILNILLGICDHQIDSITDIKINDQSYTYFKDVEVFNDRLGSLSDTLIPGFDEIVTQVNVGSKLVKDTPLTQQTSGTSVQKLKIYITAPKGLYYANDEGGLDTRTANFTVDYRVVGAPTWTYLGAYSLSGSTTSTQRKIVEIDSLIPNQYEIKITRTNDEETSFKGKNEIWFSSFQEIIKEELIYPGLAKYAIKALATDQLSGAVPRFTCLASRDTVSVFDYSLGVPAWTSKRATNPAWICYSLLVDVAEIDKDRLIWDDFYDWANYCDEIIDGDYRFDINIYITVGTIWSQLQKVALLGRAAIVRRGTRYGVFVDKPESTVSHLFTMGNIIQDSFSIQYLPVKDRANAVEIEYNDKDRDHTRQVVSVYSDEYLEDESESKKTQVSFEAAMSKEEATRAAIFRINSNKYLKRLVSFDAAIDSFACTVGDLFYFQEESIDKERSIIGSRIVSVTNNVPSGKSTIVLDQEVTIYDGLSYGLSVRLSDGTIVDKIIDNAEMDFNQDYTSNWDTKYESLWGDLYEDSWGVITTDTIILTTTWTTVPEQYDPYIFGVSNIYKKPYRLVSATRKDDFTRTITGVEYIEEIYTHNDAYVIEIPTWETRKQTAVNVILNEFLTYAQDGSYKSNINVSWQRSYTESGANWSIWIEDITAGTDPIRFGDCFENSFVIDSGLVLGNTYKIYVSSWGEGATDTGDNTETIVIQGKLAPPDDVVGFSAVWNSIKRQVVFSWTHVDNIDFNHYEIREGTAWATATKVASTTDNTAVIFIDEGVSEDRTYFIKAVDNSGVYSENAASDSAAINTSDCPLLTPTGLALSSASGIASDGRNVVTLLATWNDNSEVSDYWHHYNILLEDTATGKLSLYQSFDTEYQWEIIPNKQYGVSVRAVDVSGNTTAWSTQILHTTAKDTTPPSTPTSLTASATYTNIILKWSHGAEADLDHFLVYRNSINNSGTAVQIGNSVKEFSGTFGIYQDAPPDDSTYYYWVKAVDTSNNTSGFSNVASDAALGVVAGIGPGTITETEISDDSISTPKLKANSVVSAKIAAGEIGTDHLTAGAVTATKIDVSQLSAISADIGTITAGRIQNSGNTTYLDLTNDLMALGSKLVWNGVSLDVDGDITITGGSGIANLTDAGNLATKDQAGINDLDTTVISGGKITTNLVDANSIEANAVTAAKIDVSQLSAISADLGAITAGTITLPTTGYIRGGQTGYASGTGFFLGYSSGAYRFSVGSSSEYLRWDGSNLLVGGDIIATGNIQSNGVTQTVVTTTSGAISMTANVWTQIQSRSITVQEGGYISITAGSLFDYVSTTSKGTLQLRKGTTTVVAAETWEMNFNEGTGASVSYSEYVSSGTVTYYLYAKGNFACNASQRWIRACEFKR